MCAVLPAALDHSACFAPWRICNAQAGVDTGGRWYWATADAPNDSSHNGTSHFDSQAANAGNYDGNSDDGSSSSSHGRYSEVSGSAPATPAGGHTTFSLMPEDNPFQDITIGSLLGWGSYGRVHRGGWVPPMPGFGFIIWGLGEQAASATAAR